MEEVLSILVALVLWRLVVSVAIAVAIAVLIATAIPGASPVIVIGCVIIGVCVGIVWQSNTESPQASTHIEQGISWPISLLGLSFTGLVWAGLIEAGTKSAFIAAAVLVATPFIFSPVVVLATRRTLSIHQQIFGSVAMSSGYAALHVIRTIGS